MNTVLAIRLLGFIIVACAVSAGAGEAVKNPYLTAKVGDWAKYRMTGDGEKKVDRGMIKTVEIVTEEKVVIKVEALSDGKIESTTTQTIWLNQPYSLRTHSKGVLTPNGTGNEKVKAAGKEFETTWTSDTIIDSLGNWEMHLEVKNWLAADAPMDGLVKAESETMIKTEKLQGASKPPAQKCLIELVEFGRK